MMGKENDHMCQKIDLDWPLKNEFVRAINYTKVMSETSGICVTFSLAFNQKIENALPQKTKGLWILNKLKIAKKNDEARWN